MSMFILAFVAAAASVPEYFLQTGDLLFVQPPLDATLPLDSAILATGAATIAWLRSHGVPVASNETVVHVALVYRDTQSDRVTLVEATPPVVTQTPARRHRHAPFSSRGPMLPHSSLVASKIQTCVPMALKR